MKFEIKSNPKIGDYRYIKKFALLPKRVCSVINKKEYYVWLEYYMQCQEYKETVKHIEGIGFAPEERWVVVRNELYKNYKNK